MDNIVQAIFLAFAMFALVIGLSFSGYLLSSMNNAATALIRANDRTQDYQSVSFDSSKVESRGSLFDYSSDKIKKAEVFRTRTVSVDVVISTIYRYYKENFSVEIYDSKGTLNQIFDLNVEKKIASQSSSSSSYTLDDNSENLSTTTSDDPLYVAYDALYGEKVKGADNPSYLYKAVWVSKDSDIETRLNYYVSSQKGYIANKLVDYKKPGFGLKNLVDNGSSTFTEQFIQYTYDGETYTDTNGEDIETLTVSRQEQKKIIIIYRQNES